MTPKEFAKYERRDRWCLHCGVNSPYLIPHHRANRGMGGDKTAGKQANNSSNILAVCTALNSEMESNSIVAEMARGYGWKLSRSEDPETTPVYDSVTDKWFLLDNNYNKLEVQKDSYADNQNTTKT